MKAPSIRSAAHERPEIVVPGERSRLPAPRLATAYVTALVVPLLLAAAMIPFRAEHARTLPLVLVVPVVAVALLGATGPAVVAACSAGLAYDVLLTSPYYRLAIHDSDDVVAAVTLLVVGLAVGVLSSRLMHHATSASARRVEIRHLVQFTQQATAGVPADELAVSASEHLTAVLGLRACEWRPGPGGGDGPVLLPTGNVMGYVVTLAPDRAKLPARLELPAVVGTTEVGRFVLTPDPDRLCSFEERRTAATIATLFAFVAADI